MMRAIRDNEDAAKAMGKNVVKQHLFIFMLVQQSLVLLALC